MTPNELSTILAPEDDWRMMSDFAEKRRAQNRLAQRNYRRNMKQRIRDLEQQIATQTSMLAILGTPEGKPVDWPSQNTKVLQENPEIPTGSQLPITPKDSNNSASVISQEMLRTEFSNESGTFWSQSRGLQAQVEIMMQGESDEQIVVEPSIPVTNQVDHIVECEERQKCRKTFQQSEDWQMDHYESDFLEHVENVDSGAASAQGVRRASSSSWSEYVEGAHRSPRCSLRPTTAATLQQRVEFLLKCSEDAGFKDFDTAIYNYYTAKPDGPVWSGARESSERYGLPELLREICAGPQNWASDQARRCRDHVLHSAEEILLSELCVFTESDGTDFMDVLKSYGLRSQSIDWRHMASILQTKLPNIWLFVSALLHRSTVLHGSRMQIKLTAYIVSMLYIVDTSSATESDRFLDARI